jgi:hypothetical protein
VVVAADGISAVDTSQILRRQAFRLRCRTPFKVH